MKWVIKISVRAEGVVQEVEHQPSKHEALNSKPIVSPKIKFFR
jgi:hypothetical protein